MLQHADDLVGDAVEAQVFAERVLAGEELFLRIGADHRYARVRIIVGLTEESALGDVHLPHAAIAGIYATDAVVCATRAEGHYAILEGFRRYSLQQRNFGANVIEIVDREPNLGPGLCSASL